MPDELRQQAVGLTKSDPVETPNIDAFAAESLTLTNTLSNCPICSPARAMLLTGKYPVSNGVVDNCYSKMAEFKIELKESERCLSDILHDEGYSQGYIGKYHLDLPREEDAPYTEGWRGDPDKGGTLWDAYTPPGARRHGFDFWYSYGCCDQHFTPHYWQGDAKVDERTDIKAWSVEHETDMAINYIQNKGNAYRKDGKPFSLFVSHNPPHMPFHEVPEKYKRIYKGKSPDFLLNRPGISLPRALNSAADYFAAITGIDDNFSRILKTLKQENLEENTIVIFMSDHGEMLGSHGRMGKNSWYDEALLIPFILRWKGKIMPRKDDLLFNMPDVMPTLLGLMGLSDKIPQNVEGSDRSQILLGRKEARPSSGFYLTAQPLFPEERRGIKTLKHTFVVIRERETGKFSFVLHDNEKDPYKLENISDNEPKLVEEYTKELAKWLFKTNDPWVKKYEIFDVLNEESILTGSLKSAVSIFKSYFGKSKKG